MLWWTLVGVNWLTSCQDSGVPHVSVFGQLLFLLYTSELFFILENKLIGYADYSTIIADVPSQGLELM